MQPAKQEALETIGKLPDDCLLYTSDAADDDTIVEVSVGGV